MLSAPWDVTSECIKDLYTNTIHAIVKVHCHLHSLEWVQIQVVLTVLCVCDFRSSYSPLQSQRQIPQSTTAPPIRIMVRLSVSMKTRENIRREDCPMFKSSSLVKWWEDNSERQSKNTETCKAWEHKALRLPSAATSWTIYWADAPVVSISKIQDAVFLELSYSQDFLIKFDIWPWGWDH